MPRFGGLGASFGRLGGGGKATATAGIRLSASTFTEASAQTTAIGTLSVVGGTGTYTFTLTDNASNKAQVAGGNGVNLQAGSAAASIGTFNVTVHADNGSGSTFDATFTLSVTPAAPTLDLAAASDSGSSSTDNNTSNTSPEIDITFVSNLATNDVIRLLDGASLLTAHTVSALEASSATIALTGLSALSDGSHSLTARLERGSLIGAYSSALVLTVDTTAPTLSSPTGTTTGSNTADGSVSTNTGAGTLFWIADVGSTPSSAQVVAGQNSSGGAPGASGNQSVSGTGVQNISATGLSASTTYKFYYAHRDVAGNISTVSASSTFTTAAGYSTEANQFIVRLNSDPGTTRKDLYAAMIDGLVSDGVWSKLDVLIVAADTSANFLINLKSSSFAPTLVGSPTYTTDRGFTAASGKYLNTNYNPSTAGGLATQNSTCISFWDRTSRAASSTTDMGCSNGSISNFLVSRFTGNVVGGRINCGGSVTASVSDSAGFSVMQRTASNNQETYRNGSGTALATDSTSSNSPPNFDMFLGGYNNSGSQAGVSTDQYAAYTIGSKLTGAEVANLYSRLNTYLVAIGAA